MSTFVARWLVIYPCVYKIRNSYMEATEQYYRYSITSLANHCMLFKFFLFARWFRRMASNQSMPHRKISFFVILCLQYNTSIYFKKSAYKHGIKLKLMNNLFLKYAWLQNFNVNMFSPKNFRLCERHWGLKISSF